MRKILRMQMLKQIWNDPVGSKVIAGVILFVLGWLSTLFAPVRLAFINTIIYLGHNPFAIATCILAIIVIVLFFRLQASKSKNSEAPLTWLSQLSQDRMRSFKFLYWFPVHHTLKTSQYYFSSQNIDHIPEIRDLLDHGVLTTRSEGINLYSFAIDTKCFKYLEQQLSKFPASEKAQIYFEKIQSNDFILYFQS